MGIDGWTDRDTDADGQREERKKGRQQRESRDRLNHRTICLGLQCDSFVVLWGVSFAMVPLFLSCRVKHHVSHPIFPFPRVVPLFTAKEASTIAPFFHLARVRDSHPTTSGSFSHHPPKDLRRRPFILARFPIQRPRPLCDRFNRFQNGFDGANRKKNNPTRKNLCFRSRGRLVGRLFVGSGVDGCLFDLSRATMLPYGEWVFRILLEP